MGSSVSQALIIVAGVIIAMLVMAFVNQTFIQTGKWASTQDQEQKIEQVQKFNQEWEVYDKKLMYGVDVISCLNKALSNNDKINNGTIVNGEKYDDSYVITVKFKLKSDLKESIRVFHMNSSGFEVEYSPTKRPTTDSCKIGDVFNKTIISSLSFENIPLQEIIDHNSDIKSGEYTFPSNEESDREIEKILSNIKELRQIARNSSPTASETNSWTKAVFETALYDLKTRKFTCTGITYKADSGRVDTITFKEL